MKTKIRSTAFFCANKKFGKQFYARLLYIEIVIKEKYTLGKTIGILKESLLQYQIEGIFDIWDKKMVDIEKLTFAYPGTDRIILKDISFHVDEGEFVCILGQSGCGKSTLLRILAGLEIPTEGIVTFDGKQVEGASLSRGVVFQDYGLFPWMKAGEKIVLALQQKYPGKGKKELKERALKGIRDVGLKDLCSKQIPKKTVF